MDDLTIYSELTSSYSITGGGPVPRAAGSKSCHTENKIKIQLLEIKFTKWRA